MKVEAFKMEGSIYTKKDPLVKFDIETGYGIVPGTIASLVSQA